MSERKPQSYANHGRFDPVFHFFLIPFATLAFVCSVIVLVHHMHQTIPHILALSTLLFLVALFRMRPYALRVQDRVIRLEERLRLAMLLPEPLRARIPELSERQLIALRFASDEEIVGLVDKTLKENLPPKEIKKRIQSWRADYWRV